MWIFTMSTNDIASMSVCGMKMSVTFKDMMATKTHTDTQNLLVNVISRGFIATHFPEVACKWFAFHSPQYFQLTKSLLRKKKKEEIITSFRKQPGTCIKRAALYLQFHLVSFKLYPLACHLTYLPAKVDVLLALDFSFPLVVWLSCFIYPTCYVTSESGSSSVSFYSLWLSTNITIPSRNHQFEISLQNRDKV